MTDKIVITRLHVRGILGLNAWERETPQDLLINVEMYTDTRPAGRSDDLAESVDYDQVAKQIRLLVEQGRRFTVEALAEDIAAICLGHSGVQKVTVRLEKPGAIAEAAGVGIEIERP